MESSRQNNVQIYNTNSCKPLDLYDYDCVVRIVALSGGYEIDEACELLAKNNRMIASFSRALLQDLNAHQTQEEFDTALNNAIVKIYNASID